MTDTPVAWLVSTDPDDPFDLLSVSYSGAPSAFPVYAHPAVAPPSAELVQLICAATVGLLNSQQANADTVSAMAIAVANRTWAMLVEPDAPPPAPLFQDPDTV